MSKKYILPISALYVLSISAFAYNGTHRIFVRDSGQYLVTTGQGETLTLKQTARGSSDYQSFTGWSFKAIPGQEANEGHQFMAGGLCLSLKEGATAAMVTCASGSVPDDQNLRLFVLSSNNPNPNLDHYEIKRATADLCLSGDTTSNYKDDPNRAFKVVSCENVSTALQFSLPSYDRNFSGNSNYYANSSSGNSSSGWSSYTGGGSSSGSNSSSGSTSSGSFSSNNASTGCKRGVAYHFNSLNEIRLLSDGVKWWYNWAPQPENGVMGTNYAGLGVEYVPEVWGKKDLGAQLAPSSTVLGFNEPDLYGISESSGITPEDAASVWPQVEAMAKAVNITKIASPAIAYDVSWLDRFFAACNCLSRIDYVVVHSYPSSIDGIRSIIESVKKYNKPIWLTEFACSHGGGACSLDEQKSLMNAAVPYLEYEPQVARYAWFGYPNVPNSELIQNGQITELGRMYVNFPANCTTSSN